VNSVFAKMPFPQLHSITNIEMLQGLGARKELEKYAAVVAYADPSMIPKNLDQVHVLVNNPPQTNPYSTLKQAILSKLAESEMVTVVLVIYSANHSKLTPPMTNRLYASTGPSVYHLQRVL